MQPGSLRYERPIEPNLVPTVLLKVMPRWKFNRIVPGLIAICLFATVCPAAESAVDELIKQSYTAYQSKDISGAIELATKAVKEHPQSVAAWAYRANLYGGLRQYEKSIADYTNVLKLNPKHPGAYQERGSAYFRQAKLTEAIADWDKFIELLPSREPHHWQRGIAYYYAGRYQEGRRQFTIHQTVNSADVENAVFHFICTAKGLNLAQAKKEFIEIEGDSRVPMFEIHGLFAGKKSVEDVLKAAQSGREQNRAHQLFYANYYLGLYYESHGDDKKAREFILKAAKDADENGYMGDCARVHAVLLKRKDSK